jgi:membrane-associated phospholipid phosphatase
LTRPDNSLYIAAAAAIAFFAALGLMFARRPFAFIDGVGTKISGVGIPAAIAFTRSGYSRWLGIVAILGAIAAIALRENLAPVALLIGFQLLSQLTANAVKRLVARMRPEVWHFREELGFAYPSGHAVTAIVFYIGWAILIATWHISPEIRPVLFVLAVLWGLGIGWSRVALGAHRVTDVVGGYLLGIAWLCVFLALVSRIR